MNICPCTSVKSIRLLICTYRRWISAVTWHSYVYARHCIRFTPCARLSVPIYQMISNPQGFNPHRSWYPPVGGSRAMMVTTIVTTQWIPASSTDHLDSAISNRMTSLLLLQVFLLLSCMLFIRFLICEQLPQWFCWKLSATDPYRKQPSTPSSILAICHRVCVLQGFYFHVTHHNFLPTAWSCSSIVTSSFDCWDTKTSSLVVD